MEVLPAWRGLRVFLCTFTSVVRGVVDATRIRGRANLLMSSEALRHFRFAPLHLEYEQRLAAVWCYHEHHASALALNRRRGLSQPPADELPTERTSVSRDLELYK